MHKQHKKIVLVSVFITLISWIYILTSYSSIPNKIVGHLDFNGNINRFDDKKMIWFLLIIFSTIQYFIYWFTKKQKTKSYNIKNMHAQRTISLFTMPYISILMLLIIVSIVEKSKNIELNLSWLLYFLITITFLYLIILCSFIYKNLKK